MKAIRIEKDLDLRQGADVAEKILKNNYKNIDKDCNPWSGNEMDF